MAEKLKDPADKAQAEKEEQELEEQMKGFNISNLSMADFQQLEQAAAITPGPFEGYPFAEKVKIGQTEISGTFIVALNPKHYVFQDPSGLSQTIIVDKRDKGGKVIGKEDKVVNLRTYHSRIVRAEKKGRQNLDIVFDRELKLKDGTLMCAIVKNHLARAQLMFELTREGKIKVDTRYVLLDIKQRSRLRQVFNNFINPHITEMRVAKAITEESEESLENIS